jgi:hypothetical protein
VADFEGTIALTAAQVRDLDAFIHEPDTRQGDVFDHGSMAVDQHLNLDWIIKHDLFEGVVLQISLMTEDGTRFLAGEGRSLNHVDDALQPVSLRHDNRSYRATFKPQDN